MEALLELHKKSTLKRAFFVSDCRQRGSRLSEKRPKYFTPKRFLQKQEYF
jgi:hypothetical protein